MFARDRSRPVFWRILRLVSVYLPVSALLVGAAGVLWTFPTGPEAVASVSAPLGMYVGAANPQGIAGFASATGTHPSIASDYLPGGPTWDAMVDADAVSWLLGPWESSGYQLVLGVPIIPSDSNGNPLGSLAGGAAGDYDSYFATLAQTLVSYNEGNAILRLGWEFNGNWFAWAVTDSQDAENYRGLLPQHRGHHAFGARGLFQVRLGRCRRFSLW